MANTVKDFTAVPNFYQINPSASILDIKDQLYSKQRHLEGMLHVGAGAEEAFDGGQNIEEFFWACRVAAEEVAMLTNELISRLERTDTREAQNGH